jgi:hypothetical protein
MPLPSKRFSFSALSCVDHSADAGHEKCILAYISDIYLYAPL